MTLLPIVEALSLKLQLLGDSLFKSQLSSLHFVVGFLELGTLTMFHKVSLGLDGIMCPFLLRSSIVFFDTKSNNQIFDAHFLSLMLEVILKVFSSPRQLLNNSCNLKIFAQHHSLNMDLMEDYLKFLDLTDHSLGIYHFLIEEMAHYKLLCPSILAFIFMV